MKAKGDKLISLFLAVSVFTLSVQLAAKEKKGAVLIIQKRDGTQVRGELIAVKENSLLLIESDLGLDVTADIQEIEIIKIKRKLGLFMGAGLGSLIGLGTGYVVGSSMEIKPSFGPDPHSVGMIVGTPVGLLLGGVLGLSVIRTDKTIRIEGKSKLEIQEILQRLRKKARIKNAL